MRGEIGKGEVDREVQVVTFCVYLFIRDLGQGEGAQLSVEVRIHVSIGGYRLITYVVPGRFCLADGEGEIGRVG